MKQAKGRGVVIMDKTKYLEKGLTVLSMKQFQILHLTKQAEEILQRMLRKIKFKFTTQKYKRLYPGGFCPEKCQSMTKLPKINS